MAEYIDRQAFEKALTIAAACGKDKDCRVWAKAICVLHDMPTADVAPVVHGRWLGWGKGGTPTYENYGTCSMCGEDAEIYTGHRNYCPNCGAKMDVRSINGGVK